MLPQELPAIRSSFEMWKEDGVLHLHLRDGAVLNGQSMFELLRLASALDPAARAPLLAVCGMEVHVREEAMVALRRACKVPGRCVAIHTSDLQFRLTTELFRKVYAPPFQIKAFGMHDEARRWLRERMQLQVIAPPRLSCS